MKIAIVVSHPIQHFCPWYSSISGNENIDLEVFFVSKIGAIPYRDIDFDQTLKWNNLYLQNFKHHFLNNDGIIEINSRLDSPKIYSSLDEFGPDLVIIYGYWQKFQKRVVNWAIENKKSLAYISDAELKRKRFFFHELVKSVYLRFFFAKIDYFLVVGDSNACFYLKHGVSERKLVNSPFPIDIVNYMKVKSNYVKNRNEFRGQFEVADGELVFTMVGKAVSWKRPLDVISLLYEIEKFTTIKICFFFIGSGPLLNLMKELAGNLCRCRVVFPGFVNPEDLPRFYAGTDLYIHTASYEPHSLAVSEAIFMGCPILISDRCGSYGLNDDVQPGVNGEIYKCGDINDLFNNVVKLVTTPNLLSEYSLNSSRIAEFKQTQAHFGGISTLFNKFHFANE